MLGMLVDMMQRWNVDSMRVQKTKWDGSKFSSMVQAVLFWYKGEEK